MPPKVTQYRNAHNYLADFNAEHDLYLKSGALVDFLLSWDGEGETLPSRMEELFIELYERDFLGDEKDIRLCQAWLNSLISVGYEFPKVILKA